MLAEIFILRLETAARVQNDFGLKEAASSKNPRFVPFTSNSQFTFTERTAGVADRREEARSAPPHPDSLQPGKALEDAPAALCGLLFGVPPAILDCG